jgi:hypothetical protein
MRVIWLILKLRGKFLNGPVFRQLYSKLKEGSRHIQLMAFRSVNLNPPRGPRGGGGGRGGSGGNYRGAGGGGRGGGGSGYNTPPLRIDPSGRVDQGFGPVGGAAAAADLDFDIFGIDPPSTFQPQQQQQQQQPVSSQPILYVPPLLSSFLLQLFAWSFSRSMEYYVLYYSNLDLERAIYSSQIPLSVNVSF